MSIDEINRCSIGQIEGILEGINANNKLLDSSKNDSSPTRLEDSDALRFLVESGGTI